MPFAQANTSKLINSSNVRCYLAPFAPAMDEAGVINRSRSGDDTSVEASLESPQISDPEMKTQDR